MNWDYIIGKLFSNFFYCFVIYISYYISKFWVQNSRKAEINKATLLDKILQFAGVVATTAVIGFIFAFPEVEYPLLKTRYNLFYIIWITICLPALLGTYTGFYIDNKKMSDKEREQIKNKFDSAKRELGKYDNGY